MLITLRNKTIDLGVCKNYNDTLLNVIVDTINAGLYSVMIINKRLKIRHTTSDEMQDVLGVIDRYPLNIFLKLPSFYNLCGSLKFLAWNGNVLQDTNTKNDLSEIENNLQTLTKLSGTMIIEAGAYRDKKHGILACIKSLNTIQYKKGNKLLLINSLNDCSNVCTSINDLYLISSKLNDTVHDYLNIAINLNYLFYTGQYDTRVREDIDRLFNDFKLAFNYSIPLIVMSDCCRSGAYECFLIGSGDMWTFETLKYITVVCKRYNTIIIGNTDEDVNILREFLEK